jgi:chitinase
MGKPTCLIAALLAAGLSHGCTNEDPDPAGTGGASGMAGAAGASAGTTSTGGTGGTAGTTASGAWSMGYYASWQPTMYPVSEIEWSGLTHVAMAFYMPQADGSLSLLGGNPALATELVNAAHAHGVKAVASIGGADSQPNFQQATASGMMAAFVTNLVGLLNTGGYDGIDIDWEPMDVADEPFVIDIANRVRQANSGALMTIPIGCINVNLGADLSGFSAIAAVYDQLNLMSYGMSGAWQGWKSWHSSPLYQTDSATPMSIDSTVKLYLAAGVPAAKLGVGIGFYGLCYPSPVTGPGQAISTSMVLVGDGAMSYTNIMSSYHSASARQWDSLARVPYLSYGSPHAPDGCTYISYDDEQSIQEKGAYLKSQGLGGVIQWEINEGYLPSAAAGARSPLLLAVRDYVLQ